MVDQEQDSSNQSKAEENMQQPSEPGEQATFEFDSAGVKPKHISVTDEELRSLQKELLDYKDKYLRLLADAENARKRLQKEKQEMTRHAVESFVVDILRPLDNLENALLFAQEMSDEVRNWAFGFQMILTQFKDVLAQHHVMPFDSVGKPFNPHEHEAIEVVESVQAPGTVVEENVRGYRMGGDRIIRVARVKVAKSPEKPASE